MKTLHSPDFSWPVVRRKAAAELLDLVAEFSEIAITRGRSIVWKSGYPSRTAYWMAVSRLRKAGLIARRRTDGGTPVLKLSAKGKSMLPDDLRPERFWQQRWNGVWYLLSYDVPEVDRKYRHTLRTFLKRLRMGLLHRSVWITWRDIRPEYHDLCEAASVQDFAMLFETRTVLGLDPERLVGSVWPMDRVEEMHNAYLEQGRRVLVDVEADKIPPEAMTSLAHREIAAYHEAMQRDPLLPRALWPSSYRGQDVYRLHRQLVQTIGRRL
ncbi:MAG: PaaX family transcriptional regulator C-terminal domain-containing protein [bacterium]